MFIQMALKFEVTYKTNFMLEHVFMRFITYYSLFIIFGFMMRMFVRHTVHKLHQPAIYDLLTTVDQYGINLGHMHVFRVYGGDISLFATLFVGMFHSYLVGCDRATSNPLTHIVSLIFFECSVEEILIRIVINIVGVAACHPIAMLVLKSLMPEHAAETLSTMHCLTFDSEMPPLTLSVPMEFVGTLVMSLVFMKGCKPILDHYEPVAKFCIGMFFHVAGIYCIIYCINVIKTVLSFGKFDYRFCQ